MKARLYQKYVEEVRPALMEKRKYRNTHQVPRIEKIVINMGVSAQLEKSAVDDAARDLSFITGRKPVINKSRKSVDNIKRHQGMDVTIVTTAPTDEEALDLLKLMGMPFAEGR